MKAPGSFSCRCSEGTSYPLTVTHLSTPSLLQWMCAWLGFVTLPGMAEKCSLPPQTFWVFAGGSHTDQSGSLMPGVWNSMPVFNFTQLVELVFLGAPILQGQCLFLSLDKCIDEKKPLLLPLPVEFITYCGVLIYNPLSNSYFDSVLSVLVTCKKNWTLFSLLLLCPCGGWAMASCCHFQTIHENVDWEVPQMHTCSINNKPEKEPEWKND